jgi:hypothetical protein
MGDEGETPFDPEFLKGIIDIVKNRTLFFIPFFGAHLAFLGKQTSQRDIDLIRERLKRAGEIHQMKVTENMP